MNDRATASHVGEVLPDGTPWPEDAIEVARIVDAWGIKGGIKLQPFSSDPQALFCTKKWFVRPADKPAGVARPVRGKTTNPASAPQPSAAVPAKLNETRLLKVKSAREQGDLVVATLDGMDNRNDAEALKGARVFVSRSAFPTPDPDEFYWIDLIGLSVVNREGQALGTVIDLLDTGPHCVLRCQVSGDAVPVPSKAAEPPSDEPGQTADAPEHAGERLIPFVAAYIDSVSLADRLIVADWGLDY